MRASCLLWSTPPGPEQVALFSPAPWVVHSGHGKSHGCSTSPGRSSSGLCVPECGRVRVPIPTGPSAHASLPHPPFEASGNFPALPSRCLLGLITCPHAAESVPLLAVLEPSRHLLCPHLLPLQASARVPWLTRAPSRPQHLRVTMWVARVGVGLPPHSIFASEPGVGGFWIREALKKQHIHLKGHILKTRERPFVAGGTQCSRRGEFLGPGPSGAQVFRMGGAHSVQAGDQGLRTHLVGSVGGVAGAQGQGPVGRTPTCPPGSLCVPGGPPAGPAGSGRGLRAGPLQGLPLGTQGGGGVWAASCPWMVEAVSTGPFAAWVQPRTSFLRPTGTCFSPTPFCCSFSLLFSLGKKKREKVKTCFTSSKDFLLLPLWIKTQKRGENQYS